MSKRILIAGLGLIGGSIALNLKDLPDVTLIGYDHDKKTRRYALDNHIISEAFDTFSEAALDVDVIILACPVSITVQLIRELDRLPIDKPVLVTDVSSVKGNVLAAAEALTNPNLTFIGGHPMAGSHKKGIEAAKAHLFENAIYVLTPTKGVSDEEVEILKTLLKSTRSKFMVLDELEHDEMTSVISHFPHLIASALVNQAQKWQEKHPSIPTLAAGGFRDITRIASSNPAMWQDIFFQNKVVLSQLLDEWLLEMKELKNLLALDDKISMFHYLEQAKAYRDGLDRKKKGAIPSFYDLYVDISDQPGALQKVVTILAEASISIKNIEILEIREGITGVLRLSLMNKKDQLKAKDVLENKGYETMIEE